MRRHNRPCWSALRKASAQWRTAFASLVLFIVASALLAVNPCSVRAEERLAAPLVAQADFAKGASDSFSGTLFAQQPQLFSNNGRIRLLVLALNPSGLTETATEQIGLILQKNLNNTGHFDVVGPREMNTAFEKSHPDLVDCREIACGVEGGKVLGAERVLVGTLRLKEPVFMLHIRLIDVANNLTDYEEEVHFNDQNMDDVLFRLSNTISRNSLLTGRVLSTSIRGLVISMGKTQGIKLGDYMVVYKQQVPITDLEGKQIDVQRKNVAIVKVLNVNENTSEAILAHKVEDPQVSQFVHTYLDPQRQIELVENTRKELDTGIRLANKIRPLELAPVLLADSERKKWQRSLAEAQAGRDLWFSVGIVGGVATLIVLNNFKNDTNSRIQLGLAGGVTGYAFWKWNQFRNAINDLTIEGRVKGFARLDVLPLIGPDSLGVQVALRF